MSEVDYSQMTLKELKQYFLTHRDDKSAFYAYLDRQSSLPRPILIKSGELEGLSFEAQIKLVTERLQARFT